MSGLPAGVLPLDPQQTSNLHAAMDGLSPLQLQWVSGYVAGLAAANGEAIAAPDASRSAAVTSPASESDQKLTVLYGSQTGNGEALAESLVQDARSRGYSAVAISLADYKPANLKRELLVTFVISTHGEGDPPDDAEIFHDYLMSDTAPKLPGLKYSVLALGDSSYVNFCETGREFDARLSGLGAERFEPLVECDLDYEEPATAWSNRVVDGLDTLLKTSGAPPVPLLRAVQNTSAYSKSNPFPAEVLVNQKITGGQSAKDVRHIELSIEGSGLTYEPGDSLAILPTNPPELVSELLQQLKLDGQQSVVVREKSVKLVDALREQLEITAVNLAFLRDWAGKAASKHLSSLLAGSDSDALGDFVDSHQIIDVVRKFPAAVDAQTLVDLLRRLSPRSYSIASSLAANPDEVHLTVAEVRYTAHGSEHWGAASTHLVDRLQTGDTVPVFVERNTRFRLPAGDVPIIMIGPGTGVAPFRAFVEERKEQNATGDSWLFFGDRSFDSDFLYQLEWQRHLKQGSLTRLDVAFSRDQRHKIYVQDRMCENGAELYRWIENGAAIYVCGDSKHMAGDVNAALIDVLVTHGSLQVDAAEQRLKELRTAGRYQRDVY
ncbi:MAG TPA: assimilatory sulfite reductase (NADPH) flavoprotein subunit [Woeseiaceae bacterium]|nr:assimilatory sulfite reductase (NADPH) flavoprotein subunit [Woeseiaceae bacterium]